MNDETMNCLDTIRLIRTDPTNLPDEALAHLEECAQCHQYSVRAARLEEDINQAARTSVPENLEERILLRQSFAVKTSQPFWKKATFAIAASMLLVVALTSVFFFNYHQNKLAREVVELIHNAPYALEAVGPVGRGELVEALKPVGLSLDGKLDNVRFASRCYVRGRIAGHLVLQGKQAPVTVFLMPHERVTGRSKIRSAHFRGILLPSDGGAIAILGSPDEQSLENIEKKITRLVRWEV